MGAERKVSDKQIEKSLIETEGQPTIVAKNLGVSYITIWRRIEANKHLQDIKNGYKAKTFQNVANMSLNVLLTGIIQEPVTDDDGNVIEGKFVKRKVDYRSRLSLIPNMMQTFKGSDGIKDELDITTEGNINISDWLTMNNSKKNNKKNNDNVF